MSHTPKRLYRITNNADERAPFALLDVATDEIVRVGATARALAEHAFDHLNADEVRHDETLISDYCPRS